MLLEKYEGAMINALADLFNNRFTGPCFKDTTLFGCQRNHTQSSQTLGFTSKQSRVNLSESNQSIHFSLGASVLHNFLEAALWIWLL
jgi:hypothetical protein